MTTRHSTSLRDAVITLVGICLLLGFAQYASAIVVPFLLALFIAIIAASPVNWLKKRGVPDILSIGIVLLAVLAFLALISLMLGNTMNQFNLALPEYETRLKELMGKIVSLLSERGFDLKSSGILEAFDPSVVMTFANTLVIGLADVLSNTVLIMFTTMFMLFDVLDFPRKFEAVEGSESQSERVLEQLALLVKSTNDYIVIKAIMSLGTGILIWLSLVLLGLDFALLWGVVAFILNFVPNIGSLLAAVPAVLLAFVQLGPGYGLVVIVLYVAVNIIMGNVVEPRIMGKRLGLSTLTVFLSLVFWGWLFGPVGMLLSVPLTMAVKFAAMNNPQTTWFGVLLSPVPEEQTKKINRHND
ncbi:MAG: AI-2 transport protein TqsA [Desulforhopalus sp.]|jgi:AI-2 transport protein TqsA